MMTPSDVTLVKEAIHNPNEPRHFMRVVPARTRQVATLDGQVVADSTAAVVVKEVGLDIYDAVVYFHRSDVIMDALRSTDKTTHCPLKGDAEYFDIVTGDGSEHPHAAWSYVEMVVGDELRDLVALDPTQVRVTDSGREQR